METQNKKEIIVKDIYIPDNYIKVLIKNEKDFFDTMEDEANYFYKESSKECFVFGEGLVFIYERQ